MSEQKNKFEAMLEKLVADDKQGAEELFHDIVVEKSRDIYENLLADDVEEKEVDEAAKDDEVEETTKDDEVDEASKNDDEETTEAKDEEAKEDDKDVKEDFDLDEFEVEPATEADPTDDMMGDMEMPADDEGEGDMDDAEGGDEEAEVREDLRKENEHPCRAALQGFPSGICHLPQLCPCPPIRR